ncbi:protein YgfX [Pseudomonas sp. NFACC02]|uniref:protein YgfX n=1 Tax=Pseudomonas sp. NFACC02 TaxID=1566250 RepID=UPI000B88ED57|nr:protein YgfX [Pseudomonas sp. NFACC02]
MSSRNDRFECRWQRSRALLTAYIGAQLLALIAVFLLDIPVWAKAVGVLLCLLHGLRYLHRSILLSHEHAYTGLRRDSSGWQVWNEHGGWQAVQLRPDSMALPRIVVLRFRLMTGNGLTRRWVRSVCIPADAMAPDLHRRLRLRLKFSRNRWAAPE